ncbi:MAG: hypothetical protein BWY56_02607 [Acidobacteria bacterium ADurb.Bin340]|nr:MAG: hypothetical protein BWY56_02607 [Acidobacteria bacterium ADurb.Bin340]
MAAHHQAVLAIEGLQPLGNLADRIDTLGREHGLAIGEVEHGFVQHDLAGRHGHGSGLADFLDRLGRLRGRGGRRRRSLDLRGLGRRSRRRRHRRRLGGAPAVAQPQQALVLIAIPGLQPNLNRTGFQAGEEVFHQVALDAEAQVEMATGLLLDHRGKPQGLFQTHDTQTGTGIGNPLGIGQEIEEGRSGVVVFVGLDVQAAVLNASLLPTHGHTPAVVQPPTAFQPQQRAFLEGVAGLVVMGDGAPPGVRPTSCPPGRRGSSRRPEPESKSSCACSASFSNGGRKPDPPRSPEGSGTSPRKSPAYPLGCPNRNLI